MQPPLPEVPKVTPVSIAKPAFLGLKVVVVTDLIFNFVTVVNNLFFVKYAHGESILFPQIAVGICLCLYVLVDYFLWRGFNWARWVIIASSVNSLFFCIFGEYFFPSNESESLYPGIEGVLSIVYSIWNFVIASWLLLPGVARHFKTPKPT